MNHKIVRFIIRHTSAAWFICHLSGKHDEYGIFFTLNASRKYSSGFPFPTIYSEGGEFVWCCCCYMKNSDESYKIVTPAALSGRIGSADFNSMQIFLTLTLILCLHTEREKERQGVHKWTCLCIKSTLRISNMVGIKLYSFVVCDQMRENTYEKIELFSFWRKFVAFQF